jgi:hypothetical protein
VRRGACRPVEARYEASGLLFNGFSGALIFNICRVSRAADLRHKVAPRPGRRCHAPTGRAAPPRSSRDFWEVDLRHDFRPGELACLLWFAPYPASTGLAQQMAAQVGGFIVPVGADRGVEVASG